MTIKDLKPALVFSIFDEINQVPRPSKKEEKIRQYLLDFAAKHNIEVKTDAIGNVAMFKPATPGKENAPTVVLQSHMDMVCESNDKNFDFDNSPIRTIVDGDWLRADGTTLGADNGIGMAASLAVMVDKDLVHGPVEALFTVDEETGLTGANNLGDGMIAGEMLLNLDSEDDGEIFIGCAGGGSNLGGLIAPFMGEKLRGDKVAHYFTGHCTGKEAYERLKRKLGDRLGEMPAGSDFTV